jgi:hypothetical protein
VVLEGSVQADDGEVGAERPGEPGGLGEALAYAGRAEHLERLDHDDAAAQASQVQRVAAEPLRRRPLRRRPGRGRVLNGHRGALLS